MESKNPKASKKGDKSARNILHKKTHSPERNTPISQNPSGIISSIEDEYFNNALMTLKSQVSALQEQRKKREEALKFLSHGIEVHKEGARLIEARN